MKYDHRKIEKKWQKKWAAQSLYKTPDKAGTKDNFYLLVEFPYPSGNLHVGHWYAFAVPDIVARMQRMKGKNVLYPIGFDAFGLPAENAAIKNKLDPRKWTERNMAYMRKQIASMGTSFDWSREVVTCDPKYYRWTQWLFLQFFKAGLAYQKETPVNWCPVDKTVLANEQVVDGACERCGSEVVQKLMLQWNMKITEYADRLLEDLTNLDWPEQIKESQRNWIGRSEGAEIDFPLQFDEQKKYTYVLLHGYQGTPESPRFLYWKRELEKQGHRVIIPALPNPNDPSEDEQVAAALRAASYDANTVLFGHSLGATVALKVLEKLEKPIARLVLAGTAISPQFKDKRRPFEKNFSWKFDAESIRRNVADITVLHDPRDYAIGERQRAQLEELLGVKAHLCSSEEPHFVGEREPDILQWLRPTVRVFTTRADTLFGATYLVLAPEHPLLRQGFGGQVWVSSLKNRKEVETYIEQASKKTEMERMVEQKEKTGVRLEGVRAINPATGTPIPLYVADYVLGHYGTGAIMAVPAHDERDFEFATKFGLPIVDVVEPLHIRSVGPDKVHEGTFADRNAVIAVVKHWSDEKYLCLAWKAFEMKGFVCGGMENGEDVVATGKREIHEETGYKNARFVKALGSRIHSKFFQPQKESNTFGHFTPLLFQLENDERDAVEEHEQALHDIHWIEADKVPQFVNRPDFTLTWQRCTGTAAYTGEGIMANSAEFNGMRSQVARTMMTEKFGRARKTYKLRDWIVSRQRYWGVPIPVIHCDACGTVPVPEKDLPVELPKVKDYLPEGSGKSPLAKVKKWVAVRCPSCKGAAQRETDTLDTFVDSSWYFLRYTDPKNAKAFADKKKQANWMPVDLYSGGAEHTTMHLLYSRFWHKALYDLKLVADAEPYRRRMSRSIILGPDGQKMSKSRGNVVDPDEVVARLGADTVRMYLAFIGPYNEVSSYPWNPDGVVGIRRFLERVVRAIEYVQPKDVAELDGPLHRSIRKVEEDIEAQKFNTAISQLMIFLNSVEKQRRIGRSQLRIFLQLLSPFAPHLAEELWERSGGKGSIHASAWPEVDAARLQERTRRIAVQVDGKTRGSVEADSAASEKELVEMARAAVAPRLIGRVVDRVVVVKDRLVNFVLAE